MRSATPRDDLNVAQEIKKRVRSTNRHLCWVVPSFLKKCVRSVPIHVSGNNSTWRVPPEGCHKTVIMLQLDNGWADCLEIMYMVSSLFKNYDIANWNLIQSLI